MCAWIDDTGINKEELILAISSLAISGKFEFSFDRT